MTDGIRRLAPALAARLAALRRLEPALPYLALAAAGWALTALRFEPRGFLETYGAASDAGLFLLRGVGDPLAARFMPLPRLLFAAFADPAAVMPLLLRTGLGLVFALSWTLGFARGGARTAALYLLAAAAASAGPFTDPEQLLFALLIVLYLNMEALEERSPGPAGALASGLALGATLLTRSALFLFPPPAAAGRVLSGGRPASRLLKSALPFLIGAYVLLLPWARLNHALFGGFSPFERGRAEANLIAGVKGSVFTMEGDARALAGLAPGESAYGWAAREVLRAPGRYALAVARRVWRTVLLFPLGFALALAALLLGGRADRRAAWLALYFLLVHCLLAVEERYFYPLKFLLAFVAVSGLPAGPAPAAGRWALPARGLFAAALAGALFADLLVLAYPARAARPPLAALDEELAARPGDPWLLKKKGEALLRADRTAEGLEALALAARASGGRDVPDAYILGTLAAAEPAPPPAGYGEYSNSLLPAVRLLRELDLGRYAEARGQLAALAARWRKANTGLHGAPYAGDRRLQEEIAAFSNTLSDNALAPALLYWPPERRPVLLARLEEAAPAPVKSAAAALLAMPLKNRADLDAFVSFLERTPPADYLEPLHYGGIGRKLLAAAALRYGPAGKDDASPLGLAAAAPGGAQETAFSAGELLLLGDAVLNRAPAARLLALLRLKPGSAAYLRLYAAAARAAADGGAASAALLAAEPGIFASAALRYGASAPAKEAALYGYLLRGSAGLSAAALRSAAGTFLAGGKPREAAALLAEAVKKDPSCSSCYAERGLALRRAGDAAGAARDFAAALKAGGVTLENELNLAAALLAAGKGAPAENGIFRRGAPPEAELKELGDRTGLLLVGADFFAASDPDRAAALARHALKAPGLTAGQLRSAAVALQSAGRGAEALAALDAGVALFPRDAGLLNDRGVARRLAGDNAGALRDFEKALELAPGAWQAQLNRADLLALSGRRAEASAAYRSLLLRRDLPALALEAARNGAAAAAR